MKMEYVKKKQNVKLELIWIWLLWMVLKAILVKVCIFLFFLLYKKNIFEIKNELFFPFPFLNYQNALRFVYNVLQEVSVSNAMKLIIISILLLSFVLVTLDIIWQLLMIVIIVSNVILLVKHVMEYHLLIV